ncbi:DUF2182 domain-containing protein [Sphingomicrobium astaxanthinifaciens]|uniref:DUF2182 domain-containing protein n=1 Tax=Sphingomicrobium astaxanthinifaciens TaxID=1227949 RepID=UPI001FCB244B|nr:DUF2182 domain-containing protein [Sphingomicrobium astaxanthinifaciens]MCJ7421908.1 DUF2182 domain-containing protein [Sphingomicrobium astaxanthinifaciens]
MRAPTEALLARHRSLTIAALGLIALLAWGWLLAGAGMGMGISASLAPFPHREAPTMAMAVGFPLLFAMWWVMMVAMMLPAAAPTILLYARAARHGGIARPAVTRFLLGYLLVWGLFSALAAALQLMLQREALVTGMAMASASRWLSGGLLIAAGLYQFSPVKDRCLALCRHPAVFIARHQRPGAWGVLRLGLLHGTYCAGCCWALMALLFVLGVMNIAWIALLTLLVAAEKLLPAGRAIARVGGALLILWGLASLLA